MRPTHGPSVSREAMSVVLVAAFSILLPAAFALSPMSPWPDYAGLVPWAWIAVGALGLAAILAGVALVQHGYLVEVNGLAALNREIRGTRWRTLAGAEGVATGGNALCVTLAFPSGAKETYRRESLEPVPA